jgi:hypothetical protein
MCGHAQDVQVAVADLEHEQYVEPARGRRSPAAGGYRAVDVEEVDREHAGGLCVRRNGLIEYEPTA